MATTFSLHGRLSSIFLGSHLLETGPASKWLGYGELAVDDFQWQGRQASRRRPAHYLSRFLRIISRVMAGTLEKLAIGVPTGHVTAGVHTYRRIGDNIAGGTLLGFGVAAFRVKAQ